ncbi:MAG: VOC family protein [Candidatus Omnitrophica bacterium]|nr:VOC family protein [Candidatus Omnitrophota bacterium]
MGKLKLGHIAISISSIEKSSAFYEKNFGFKLKEHIKGDSQDPDIAILENNTLRLELFEFKEPKALPEYRKNLLSELQTLGVKHFALETEDIEPDYQRLKNQGVCLGTDINKLPNGLRYFFIKDPDGIFIELIERKEKK